MEALVENIDVCLLLADWCVGEWHRTTALAAAAGCCDPEVSVVVVHGELVQNVSRYGSCGLVGDCETVYGDTVHYSLLALTPYWLCEIDVVEGNVDRAGRSDQIDLRGRTGVVLCRVESDDGGEAVALVDNVRVIDLCGRGFYYLAIDDLLWEQDLAVADDWLCCYKIDVVSN